MFLPVVMAFTAAALFGAATPVTKGLLTDLTPFQLAGLLYLGAAIGVGPSLLLRTASRRVVPSDSRNRIRLIGAVLFGGVLGPLLLLLGLRTATAASVSMWLNLELVATAVLGVLLFKDHLGPLGWIAVAGTVAAAVFLSIGEGVAGIAAGSLVAVACLCWGLDNHLTALIDGLSPQATTFVKGLFAGATNLAVGLVVSEFNSSIGTVLLALLVGALSYGLSIVLYISSAQAIGATRGQMVFSSAPFIGVLLSVVLLGEVLSTLQIAAAAVLVASVTLMVLERHRHRHEHPAIEHTHWHSHDEAHHTHDHIKPPLLGHSHTHMHGGIIHSHAHLPDIHHRHSHDSSGSATRSS